MSQMPDKIWLHKDTKYNTGDVVCGVVCGYQYDFVQGIEDEGGIENFVEYVNKENFINNACEWLENHNDYISGGTNGISRYDMQQLVKDFKNYMKGE